MRMTTAPGFFKRALSPLLARIFHKSPSSTRGALINTPLQRGVTCRQDLRNRFNGFSRAVKTVETGFLEDTLIRHSRQLSGRGC
jgi:hypothetical protein